MALSLPLLRLQVVAGMVGVAAVVEEEAEEVTDVHIRVYM